MNVQDRCGQIHPLKLFYHHAYRSMSSLESQSPNHLTSVREKTHSDDQHLARVDDTSLCPFSRSLPLPVFLKCVNLIQDELHRSFSAIIRFLVR
jgi:hypothetical protein